MSTHGRVGRSQLANVKPTLSQRSYFHVRRLEWVGPGPDLDLWGPLGKLSCGGPQLPTIIFFFSEASEPLGVVWRSAPWNFSGVFPHFVQPI